MSSNRVDVYIAVEYKNMEITKSLFSQNNIDFENDDMCSPFSDDESLHVFYIRDVRHGDTDHETSLLLNNHIPFSLFHRAGSDFHYGWTHSRLRDDGSMSFIQYFGDGEMVSCSEIQTILNNVTSIDEAKKAVNKIVKDQQYPNWS